VEGEVRLWDLPAGKERHVLRGHTGAVGSLAFSADGKTLASAGGLFDGRVRLWDVAAGADLGALGEKAEVAAVAGFGPKDGTLVVLSASPTGKDQRGMTVRVGR
jgi:WD40 repeat protein